MSQAISCDDSQRLIFHLPQTHSFPHPLSSTAPPSNRSSATDPCPANRKTRSHTCWHASWLWSVNLCLATVKRTAALVIMKSRSNTCSSAHSALLNKCCLKIITSHFIHCQWITCLSGRAQWHPEMWIHGRCWSFRLACVCVAPYV